jgi:hypothetical protein
MAVRATWMLAALAALPLALGAARAQNSEYDALPEPAAPAPTAIEAPHPQAVAPAPTKSATPSKEKSAPAIGAKEPAKKQNAAALNAKSDNAKPKEPEPELSPGRRMAPSAAIPPFAGDEKAPKTIDFLGGCAGDYDRCMQTIREVGEKLPDAEICIPPELDFTTVTERVRKWATLRPDVHGLPIPRVIAAALRSIYPCKHTPPARTAAERGASKAKAAQ